MDIILNLVAIIQHLIQIVGVIIGITPIAVIAVITMDAQMDLVITHGGSSFSFSLEDSEDVDADSKIKVGGYPYFFYHVSSKIKFIAQNSIHIFPRKLFYYFCLQNNYYVL